MESAKEVCAPTAMLQVTRTTCSGTLCAATVQLEAAILSPAWLIGLSSSEAEPPTRGAWFQLGLRKGSSSRSTKLGSRWILLLLSSAMSRGAKGNTVSCGGLAKVSRMPSCELFLSWVVQLDLDTRGKCVRRSSKDRLLGVVLHTGVDTSPWASGGSLADCSQTL